MEKHPAKEVGSGSTQLLMSRRTKSQLPTADALLKTNMKETNVKEMLTMKHQRSKEYYGKIGHALSALREGDIVRVKPNLEDKTAKWRRGQIISKLGERLYLEDLNGRSYQRNCKFLRATSELPNTTFENTTEETLETMKCNIENEAVIQSPSKATLSLIKDVQQEQKTADTKNRKQEIKRPVMRAKSEVPKERMSQGDCRIRNENDSLHTRTTAIKKSS